MSVAVVEKRKGTRTCGDCGGNLAGDAKKCQNCGSTDIRKSVVIVRKEVEEPDDDNLHLEDIVEDEDLEGTEDLDDEDEEDEDEDESDSEDEDEDESDEDEEDEEEEDEEEDDDSDVQKSFDASIAGVEALNLSTALAENVMSIMKSANGQDEAYETVMTEFNAVMDAAFDTWKSGSLVTKADAKETQTALIHKRVAEITKEGNAMPDLKRPDNFDSLDDATKAYITSLEEGKVEKKDDSGEEDIFKGLTPAAALIVKRAQDTMEQAEQEKYLKIAKSLEFVPGDREELAKSLRTAAETSPEAYKVLHDSLTAANENLKDSAVFKSFGNPGSGGDEETQVIAKAKKMVEDGQYPTVEQAQVALMNGADYVPTTK